MPQVAVRPLERAREFGELHAAGVSVAAIAQRVGLSTSSVRNYLDLLELDEVAQRRVGNGLSVDEAARAVRAARSAAAAAKPRQAPPQRRRAVSSGSRLPGRHSDHVHTAKLVNPRAEWMARAACKGRVMEPPLRRDGLLLTDQERVEMTAAALDICRYSCPVLADCKEWVLGIEAGLDPGGVCGGMTPEDRADARGERARRAKARSL